MDHVLHNLLVLPRVRTTDEQVKSK